MDNQHKFFVSIAVMIVALFAISSANNVGQAIQAPDSCIKETVCAEWSEYEDVDTLCSEYDVKLHDVCVAYNYENGMDCAMWDTVSEQTCTKFESVRKLARVCERWESKINCLV